MYTHMFVYLYMWAWVWVCLCVCLCVLCIFKYICVGVFKCIFIYIYIYIHTPTHTHIYVFFYKKKLPFISTAPGIHYVDQSDLRFRASPTSAFQVMRLKSCASTTQPYFIFIIYMPVFFLVRDRKMVDPDRTGGIKILGGVEGVEIATKIHFMEKNVL